MLSWQTNLALALALGVTGGSQAHRSAYPEQPGGMLQPFVYNEAPPPPAPGQGIYFSGFFTDHTVLQRGSKARAAVYGAISGTASSVSIKVSEEGSTSYNVAAQIIHRGVGNLTWKALLHPHASYGGNVSVTASCSGCSGNTTATISDLTYGDVWFCSGQVR